MPLIQGKGRHLNGGTTLKVSLENGVLFVSPQSLVVKGKPVPEAFMAQIRGQNFAKDVGQSPQVAGAIRKLESIVVRDGTIAITPRPPPATPGSTN